MRIEPTYANVRALVDRSCTFTTSCHGGEGDGQAHLNFAASEPLMNAWLDEDGEPRSACEYDRLPVVAPGDPDGSWLIVKVSADVDGFNRVQPGAWGPADDWTGSMNDECPDFGLRMPETGDMLADEEVTLLREWIALGTPGPESP